MRSIRLNLIVYFLVLLGLALGSISAIVYQTSHESLLAKKRSDEDRKHNRYENRCKEERGKLEGTLIGGAKDLAELVRNPRALNEYRQLHVLGILSASLSPQGQVQVPAWLAEVTPGPVAFDILRRTSPIIIKNDRNPLGLCFPLGILTANSSPNSLLLAHFWNNRTIRWELSQPASIRILFRDDVMPGNAGGRDSPYCQIVSGAGEVWQRSRSLGDNVLDLPRDPIPKGAPPVFHEMLVKPSVDAPSVNALVVTYKSALPGYLRPFNWGRGWRGPGGRIPLTGALARQGTPQDSFFFIQYARATGPRDAALTLYRTELKKDLAWLQDDLESAEATLRNHLLRISLFTFGATVLGGFWLVRLGLSPLQRLSEAVSKVSAKDFRLPLEDTHLPSELKPIVRRLTQTLDMLKRAFAREKQAAADISHELRTPLSALLTTIEVALRKPRTPEEYRELLTDCQGSGKQMSQLVERLLALARLDAGVDNLRPRDVDVAELAEQCAALVRPLAEARGILLHIHGAGPAHLTADPDKLREVITNLLHNAIEYNRPNGVIDMTIQRDNGDLRVEVRDTGIGIPAGVREHIFERFYRADPSRQADGLHAGLGLAIVKGYIDLMGGSIGVESSEGQGSTFCVRLPIAGHDPIALKNDRQPVPSHN